MLDNEARRLAASTPAAFVFVALAVAACGATGPESGSGDSTVADTLHVCDACHGPGGRSISPTFPRLAGQQKDYIVAELKAFRDKTQADPDAKAYMWGMATPLSDPTIDGIAAYYASQPPVAGEPCASPDIAAGKKIFTEGIPSEGVAPCMACHGEKAEGNGPIPSLAGQHQAYLMRELEEYASIARANEVMHQLSKGLRPDQISDVSAYLATL